MIRFLSSDTSSHCGFQLTGHAQQDKQILQPGGQRGGGKMVDRDNGF